MKNSAAVSACQEWRFVSPFFCRNILKYEKVCAERMRSAGTDILLL